MIGPQHPPRHRLCNDIAISILILLLFSQGFVLRGYIKWSLLLVPSSLILFFCLLHPQMRVYEHVTMVGKVRGAEEGFEGLVRDLQEFRPVILGRG